MFRSNCVVLSFEIELISPDWIIDSPPRPVDEPSGAQGKLMRLLENQLAQGDGPVNLEKLRAQFDLADRLHRDSLSHGEVSAQSVSRGLPPQYGQSTLVCPRGLANQLRFTLLCDQSSVCYANFLAMLNPLYTLRFSR